MAGTREGNLKIRDKLLAKDPDYFKKLGQKGGKAKVRKGYAVTKSKSRRKYEK